MLKTKWEPMHWLPPSRERRSFSGSEKEASASLLALCVFVWFTPDRYNGMLPWKTPHSFSIYEWTEGIPWLRRDTYSAPLEPAGWPRHHHDCTHSGIHVQFTKVCAVSWQGDLSLTPLCHFNWGALQWGKVQGSWLKLKQTFYQLTIASSSSWLFPRSFGFSFCWPQLTPLVLYKVIFLQIIEPWIKGDSFCCLFIVVVSLEKCFWKHWNDGQTEVGTYVQNLQSFRGWLMEATWEIQMPIWRTFI